MSFDARRYTIDGLTKQLLLLELHIRDGSVWECGCAWDAHLPVIEGLCEEGIKFAKNEEEKQFFDRLMHLARDARLKLQYGLEGEGMEVEGEHSSNPVLTVETLKEEGRLIEGIIDGKGLFQKDGMYYVVKDDAIIWSGRSLVIARNVFEGSNPEPRFRHETLQPEEVCEPSSFRTVVRNEHRIVICCPKGQWDESLPEGEQCRVGTVAQKILHPIWEKGEHAPEGE